MKIKLKSAFSLILLLAVGAAGCIQTRGPTGPGPDDEEPIPDERDPVGMTIHASAGFELPG